MTQKQLNQIEKLVKSYLKGYRNSQHDFSHVLRVKQNAKKIVDILGIKSDIDLNLLQATCLLHDLVWTKQNPFLLALTYVFEGTLIKKFVGRNIEPLNIVGWEKEIMLKAVSKHSKSFPFKKLNRKEGLYTKILQDADTLDLFNEQRVENFKNLNNLTKRISSLVDRLVLYGKRNLHRFLNFPELALYFPQPNIFSYLEWGKTNPDEEILICIHGYADSSSMFTPFAKTVSDRYRVICLDLPMQYKTKTCSIIELANYLENFRKKIGLRKFNLVGFSLGGLVAIEYSIKHSDRISRLYILNSLPCLPLSDVLRKLFGYLKPLLLLKPSLYIFSRISTNKLVRKFLSSPILGNEQRSMMRHKYIPIFGTLLSNLGYSRTGEFNKLPLPKTIVLFKDDEVFKWNHISNYAKSLQGKLKVFNKGGHATKDKYWLNIVKLF